VYNDKVSGAISFSERKEAKKLLRDIDAGLVSEAHISSIDRLGKNILDILTVLKEPESDQSLRRVALLDGCSL